MAPRPPIQAVIEEQAELDTSRRNWRMVLFNEDGTPFSGGGGSSVSEWQDITLINGWVDYSGRTCKYRIEDGGKTIRFKGTLDGQSKTDDVFMAIPVVLGDVDEAHGGITGFQPAVGYSSGEIAIDSEGIHAYVTQRCAFLDGVSLGLEEIIGIS